MPSYKLILFAGEERLAPIQLICGNDERALRLAHEQADGRQGELWRESDNVRVANWPAKLHR